MSCFPLCLSFLVIIMTAENKKRLFSCDKCSVFKGNILFIKILNIVNLYEYDFVKISNFKFPIFCLVCSVVYTLDLQSCSLHFRFVVQFTLDLQCSLHSRFVVEFTLSICSVVNALDLQCSLHSHLQWLSVKEITINMSCSL